MCSINIQFVGKQQAYGLLFSVELLETLKLSIKGSFEAPNKGIFDQGYIHSRLAILERLLNKHLTRRKNTSQGQTGAIPGRETVHSDHFLCLETVSLSTVVTKKDNCLTERSSCLTDRSICLPERSEGQTAQGSQTAKRSQTVLQSGDQGKGNFLKAEKIGLSVRFLSQGLPLSSPRMYFSFLLDACSTRVLEWLTYCEYTLGQCFKPCTKLRSFQEFH